MTREGFRRRLRPLMEKKIPFLAYWWERGCGILRLDEVQVPVIPPCENHYCPDTGPTKPHTLTKRSRKKWEKNLYDLRRTTYSPVISIEFDGERVTIKGGEFEL